MKRELQIFLTAIRFFTRIPVSSKVVHSEEMLNHSLRYFPMVGWIIGALGAAIYYYSNYVFSADIRILLSIAATILMTGAFHEDGFADVCDGFGGGYNKDQILKIMKDSRIGSYGAIGVVMILLTKFMILTNIKPMFIPIALIAGHTISRFAAASFVYTDKYVGDENGSKSKPLGNKISIGELLFAALTGFIPALWIIYWFITARGIHILPNTIHSISIPITYLFILFFPVFLSKWLLARFFRKNIGGYTGDCLGATQQITEVVFYLSFYVLINNHGLIIDLIRSI